MNRSPNGTKAARTARACLGAFATTSVSIGWTILLFVKEGLIQDTYKPALYREGVWKTSLRVGHPVSAYSIHALNVPLVKDTGLTGDIVTMQESWCRPPSPPWQTKFSINRAHSSTFDPSSPKCALSAEGPPAEAEAVPEAAQRCIYRHGQNGPPESEHRVVALEALPYRLRPAKFDGPASTREDLGGSSRIGRDTDLVCQECRQYCSLSSGGTDHLETCSKNSLKGLAGVGSFSTVFVPVE